MQSPIVHSVLLYLSPLPSKHGLQLKYIPYPFPYHELSQLLLGYPHVEDIVWCQEEPLNQGAWHSARHRFIKCVTGKQRVRFVGRPASAAPAVGYPVFHKKQQQELIDTALADSF